MNRSLIKQIGLGIFLFLGNYLILYYSQSLLNDYPYSFFRSIIMLIFYWVILMGIWSLALFFIQERIIIFLSILFSSAVSCFLYDFNYYFILSMLIIILVSTIAYMEIQKDIKSRIKVVFDLSLNNGLKKLIFPTILTITIMFYFSPQSTHPQINYPDWLRNWACNNQIPTLNYTYCQIPDLLENRIFNMFIPGINPNSTIDDLTYESLAQSMNLPGGKQQFINEIRPTLTDEQLSQSRSQIIRSLNLDEKEVTGSTQLKDNKIIANLISNRIGNVAKSETLLKLVYSVLFFEIAMFLSKLFLPISYAIFWIFYQLMIKLNIIKIVSSTSEIEKVEL